MKAILGMHWILRRSIAAFVVLSFAGSAQALDPHRKISQYSHDSWPDKRGFPGGTVSAITQTPDGYLWIGTEKGLIRFDGLNFQIFQQSTPQSFPIGAVQGLITDAAGNLWIVLQSTRVVRFHNGKFEPGRDEAEFGITAIGKRRNGSVLLSSLTYGPLSYDGRFEIIASPTRQSPATPANMIPPGDELSSRFSWSTSVATHRVAQPSSAVISMAESADGKIWMGTRDKGLFNIHDGHVSAVGSERLSRTITCILPLEYGKLWVGTESGAFKFSGENLTQSGVPSSLRHAQIFAMIRDHDANIWLGTSHGLFRVNGEEVSQYEGGSGKDVPVTSLFEDREGNLWLGRPGYIERLRDTVFATYSAGETRSPAGGPIYVDQNGRTWFAPFEGGLYRLRDGKSQSVTNKELSGDVVYSLTGMNDHLWIGRQRGGLTRVLYDADSVVSTKTYTKAEGLAQNSVYAVYESRSGTIWCGTLSGGVSELRNGHFTTYSTASGLASDTVSSIAEANDGTMWFGTPKGLSAMAANGWKTYTFRDGLPSSDVNSLLFDSSGVLWIGTAAGLAFLNGDHIRVPRGVPHSLEEPVFGMAEDKNEWLWITTSDHVLRVKRSSLTQGSPGEGDIREYGLDDGLLGAEGVKRYRSVVTDPQGNIWLSTNRGISVGSAARANINSAPALVHIEEVLADGSPFDIGGLIRLPAKTQRATFRYVGLSLANSEHVKYRYRLEGLDREWSEPTMTREATYGNLGKGPYRFRVTASNSDGLWNGSEAAVALEVMSTYWETWWFRLSCALALALTAWLLYRIRMHQKIAQLNVRFEERLAERTRIAQDLHDTLLQGVLSATMHLHLVADKLSDDSTAKPLLIRIQQLMDQVINEGRNALQGLRSSAADPHKLEQAFSRLPQELANQHEIAYRVIVEGLPRSLHPLIRDEVYRIGREALVNSFRHARASSIEISIEYTASQLRVTARDNGCGIDPRVLQAGREGHWGLQGMRERADKIGARLKLSSRPAAGTEVELLVPGNVAYHDGSEKLRCSWIEKLYR